MRAFLDTSVLVAVFQESHVHHQPSFRLFVGLDKTSGCCAAHSLAEFSAVSTALPGRLRVRPEHALLFIDSVLERLEIVGLDPGEYVAALTTFSRMGIAGGTIYDALIASCALKAEADTFYTWNVRHWLQLGPTVSGRVHAPA